MFTKYGIRSITMESIANELGISKRTLYEKFEDKDDLVSQVVTEGGNFHKKKCLEIIDESENVVDAISKIARLHSNTFSKINPLFFEDLKKCHPSIHNKIHKRGELRDYSITLSLLKRGVIEEIFRSDVDIDVVNVFIHQIADILNTNIFSNIKIEILRDSVFMPYLKGISTDKGRKLIEENLKNL